MNGNIKAIDTAYNGYLFRSRLEARWAVFMDELGIKYEYEIEGYDLDGLRYLPDFWLPTFEGGIFMEVKPTSLNEIELEKAKRLAKYTGFGIILAIGKPDYKCQEVIIYEEVGGKSDFSIWYGLMNADKASCENRMFGYPGYENKDLTISPENFVCLGDRYVSAVISANEARFEFKNNF